MHHGSCAGRGGIHEVFQAESNRQYRFRINAVDGAVHIIFGFVPLASAYVARHALAKSAIARSILVEIAVDVATAMQNIDDLQRFIGAIAEENHIALAWGAANVRAQFGPRSAERGWQCRELAALLAEPLCEVHGNVAAAAFGRDIDRNFYQIAVRVVGIV
ncbi:MAG: hypothetical protein WBO17_10965 [Sphingorhabdus sp.]